MVALSLFEPVYSATAFAAPDQRKARLANALLARLVSLISKHPYGPVWIKRGDVGQSRGKQSSPAMRGIGPARADLQVCACHKGKPGVPGKQIAYMDDRPVLARVEDAIRARRNEVPKHVQQKRRGLAIVGAAQGKGAGLEFFNRIICGHSQAASWPPGARKDRDRRGSARRAFRALGAYHASEWGAGADGSARPLPDKYRR